MQTSDNWFKRDLKAIEGTHWKSYFQRFRGNLNSGLLLPKQYILRSCLETLNWIYWKSLVFDEMWMLTLMPRAVIWGEHPILLNCAEILLMCWFPVPDMSRFSPVEATRSICWMMACSNIKYRRIGCFAWLYDLAIALLMIDCFFVSMRKCYFTLFFPSFPWQLDLSRPMFCSLACG